MEFNKEINGRLLQPKPSAYPCHDPNYNQQSCDEVKSNWRNARWRSDQIGAAEHPNWESYGTNNSCFVDTDRSTPCSPGNVPVYAVNVSCAWDIQKTIQFAFKHNLRLVVKNTGHDYLGRSSGKGAISLWMHSLKDIQFIDSFREYGCFSGRAHSAVRVGAGVQFQELNEAAYRNNRTVVGAASKSVGAAGGWVQGGGHSALAPFFGLGVDNVLEFELVTPMGNLVIANRCVNPDLFWALRGGGGGTFGVVLSVTYKTHRALSNIIGARFIITTNDENSYEDLITEFARLQPSLTDAEWGGYFSLTARGNQSILQIRYITLDKDLSSANDTFGNIITYAQSNPSFEVTGNYTSYGSYLDWFDFLLCSYYPGDCIDKTGVNSMLASRLIPRDNMETDPRGLAKAMIKALRTKGLLGTVLGLNVAGGAVARVRDNAVNPAWRRALWHVISLYHWNDTVTSDEERDRVSKILTEANKGLVDITPFSGCYQNEADYNEPNWQYSFFGPNYYRLKLIKKFVDPFGLLTCRHCVGSEDWSEDLQCRKYN